MTGVGSLRRMLGTRVAIYWGIPNLDLNARMNASSPAPSGRDLRSANISGPIAMAKFPSGFWGYRVWGKSFEKVFTLIPRRSNSAHIGPSSLSTMDRVP